MWLARLDINVENGTRTWVQVRDVYGLAFLYGKTYILQQTIGAEDSYYLLYKSSKA